MRQPQHKSRARARGRRQPNPLNRVYESNGPDVKVRGTAQHVAEKYLQLGRDALSSGDEIRAESYFQHAEHYFRIIAAAQEQYQQRRQHQQEQREQRSRGNGRGRSAVGETAAVTRGNGGTAGETTVTIGGNGGDPETSTSPQEARNGLTTSPSTVGDITPETGGIVPDAEVGGTAPNAWEGPQPGFLMQPVIPDPETGTGEMRLGDGHDGGNGETSGEMMADTPAADTNADAPAEERPKRRVRRTRTSRTTRRTRRSASSSDATGNGAA